VRPLFGGLDEPNLALDEVGSYQHQTYLISRTDRLGPSLAAKVPASSCAVELCSEPESNL
jgi:hypothetical protein